MAETQNTGRHGRVSSAAPFIPLPFNATLSLCSHAEKQAIAFAFTSNSSPSQNPLAPCPTCVPCGLAEASEALPPLPCSLETWARCFEPSGFFETFPSTRSNNGQQHRHQHRPYIREFENITRPGSDAWPPPPWCCSACCAVTFRGRGFFFDVKSF